MEVFYLIAILSASLIILLKHWGLLMIQVAALIIVSLFASATFLWLIIAIQLLAGIWLLLKTLQAVDYNYQLELEKTHRIEQHWTKGHQSGTKKNFLS
ncbi:hypothetical protein MUN88_21205 [Gracilibacillus caseinilyticus]|uniref:Uncharacterized protein n=1 Tax=Gracilibacillus caseinilyticus TaxID=2932256 RepID=A0ABY4EW56_9BACI|nr:hypothetical protein [Gracilibacillus caseinilyticus]UOQ48514.1 hypothetical protein MUN88_21205 [Gracilibacillus caseinilyticus]